MTGFAAITQGIKDQLEQITTPNGHLLDLGPTLVVFRSHPSEYAELALSLQPKSIQTVKSKSNYATTTAFYEINVIVPTKVVSLPLSDAASSIINSILSVLFVDESSPLNNFESAYEIELNTENRGAEVLLIDFHLKCIYQVATYTV